MGLNLVCGRSAGFEIVSPCPVLLNQQHLVSKTNVILAIFLDMRGKKRKDFLLQKVRSHNVIQNILLEDIACYILKTTQINEI